MSAALHFRPGLLTDTSASDQLAKQRKTREVTQYAHNNYTQKRTVCVLLLAGRLPLEADEA